MDAKFPYLKFVIDSAYSHFIRFRSYVRKFSAYICSLFKFNYNMFAQKNPRDFILYLNFPNNCFIDEDTIPLSHVMYKSLEPKEGFKITKIQDHNGVIWDENRLLNFSVIVHKDERPYMIYVVVTDGETRYFIKSEDTWNKINSEEFYDNLRALRNSVKIKERFTLNGDYPYSTDKWLVKEFKCGDTNQLSYFPQVGYEAKAVFANKKEVWRAENEGQVCELATVFQYQEKPVLIHINISDGSDTRVKFYKLINGQWENTTEDDYFKTASSHKPWYSRLTVIINDLHNLD